MRMFGKQNLWRTACCFLGFLVFYFHVSQVLGFGLPQPSDEENTSIRSQMGVETFQTSLYTGSGNTSVPIIVPPGTNGMQPQLALVYDSSSRTNDDTLIGIGWDLAGVGYIERSTKLGVPKYDSTDTYVLVLNGASSDLVCPTNPCDGYYHTKMETFLRIYYDSGSNYWLVTDKNGTQYEFGATTDSNVAAIGRNGTRRWSLDLVTDIHGNQMSVAYNNDTVNGMAYPTTITYTQGNGLLVYRTVNFNYENRDDQPISYRYGSPVNITKRLDYIDVKMNGAMVRRYDLTYVDSPDSKESLLSQVQEYGADATAPGTGTRLPPVTFTYSVGGNSFQATPTEPWLTQVTDVNSQGQIVMYLADFTGDGKADMLYCRSGTWYVAVSNGSTFNSGTQWLNGISCNTIVGSLGDFDGDGKNDLFLWPGASSTRVTIYRSTGSYFTFGWYWDFDPYAIEGKLGDFNGDGKTDVVYYERFAASQCGTLPGLTSNEDCIVWITQLSNGSGFGSPYSWFWYPISYTALWTRIGDFNGDGKSDLIFDLGGNTNKIFVAASRGTDFFGGGYWLDPHPTDSGGTPIPLSQWRFGDFNGDGLTDILIFDTNLTQASVYLSKGYLFETATTWFGPVSSWCSPANTCLPLMTVGDANGDGKTDLILLNNQSSWYWQIVLSSGKAFDAPGSGNWSSAPNSSCLADIFEDFDGDGKLDHGEYYGQTSGCPTNDGQFHIYLSSGSPVDLLITAQNSLGGSTTLNYRSTGLSNTCATSPGYLPFKVQTVCSVTQNDGMGHSITTNNSYTVGAYNANTREFRGFRSARVTDSTGAYTETYFLQDDIYKGRIDYIQVKDISNNPYSKTDNTWNSTTPFTGVNFVFLSQVDTYSYDGTSTASYKQAQTLYTYDNSNGNVKEIHNLGDTSIATDNRYDYIEYAPNTDAWILSFPTHLYTCTTNSPACVNDSTSKVAETWNYYDGATSYSTAPLKGDLTMTCQWYSGGTNPCTLYQYDFYGNRTRVTNARGATSIVSYDSTYQTYPVTETNALNHTVTRGYDSLMRLTSVTDPNNVVTNYGYDEFHRLIKETVPPDTTTSPTTTYSYLRDGIAPEGTVVKKREVKDQTETLDSYTYVDGLGRTIQTKSEGPSSTQWITVDTVYNNRGLVDNVSIPYFTSSSANTTPQNQPKTITEYNDSLRRVTRVTNTDLTYSSWAYDRWTTTITDANGHKKVETRDAFGRLVRVEEWSGSDGRSPQYPAQTYTLYSTTTYQYDTLGNLRFITDALGNATEMRYDTLGRKIFMHDPDMGNWSYEYDAAGNLIRQTDAKGQNLWFSYDPLNRVTEKNIR